MLLYIAKEHCLDDFAKLLGPFSREQFSNRPGTLRHDFDEPSVPVVNSEEFLQSIRFDLCDRQRFTLPKRSSTLEKKSNSSSRINRP